MTFMYALIICIADCHPTYFNTAEACDAAKRLMMQQYSIVSEKRATCVYLGKEKANAKPATKT